MRISIFFSHHIGLRMMARANTIQLLFINTILYCICMYCMHTLIHSHLGRAVCCHSSDCFSWSTCKACPLERRTSDGSWTCRPRRRGRSMPHREALPHTRYSRWDGHGCRQTSCADPPNAEEAQWHPEQERERERKRERVNTAAVLHISPPQYFTNILSLSTSLKSLFIVERSTQ